MAAIAPGDQASLITTPGSLIRLGDLPQLATASPQKLAAGLAKIFAGRVSHPNPAVTASSRSRLQRIQREDALEDLDRTFVLEAFSRKQDICISKRHGVWRWASDGIPGWLVPVLRDAGLLD